jgi:hypothetical protein
VDRGKHPLRKRMLEEGVERNWCTVAVAQRHPPVGVLGVGAWLVLCAKVTNKVSQSDTDERAWGGDNCAVERDEDLVSVFGGI